MKKYLQETYFFDYKATAIQNFLYHLQLNHLPEIEKAIKIYYIVRDSWKYSPFKIFTDEKKWKTSDIIKRNEGHCVDKAALLVSCWRAIGIPARLHLAKVKNHIAVEQLIKKLGTDTLAPHGYAEAYLNNKWIKATPAFNKNLCKKLNVTPLEFDGINDSVFQEFDKKGGVFMEYLEDYGTFDDLPLDFMINLMKKEYPNMEVDEKLGVVEF